MHILQKKKKVANVHVKPSAQYTKKRKKKTGSTLPPQPFHFLQIFHTLLKYKKEKHLTVYIYIFNFFSSVGK